MRAYFTASVTGKKQYQKNYESIVSLLKKNSVEVIADHILKKHASRIEAKTEEERIENQRKLEKNIHASDCIIAETSYPSVNVGYEIAYALHADKPVLVLYSRGISPSMLTHRDEEHLCCEHYDEKMLPSIIEDFLSYVHGSTCTRFTFFISSEIGSYLEKTAKKNNLPKAVYLRDLILLDMKNQSF